MARPRSEETQAALLETAGSLVAAQGLEATTASIAKRAGVAEGTLFRYFATKDILLNELYLHLKHGVADAMRDRFARNGNLEDQARSLWEGYIDWGIAHPSSIKALGKLAVSETISAETQARASRFFPEVAEVSKACAANGALASLPAGFVDAVFLAVAEATIQSATRHPEFAEAYKVSGFKAFWSALTD